MTTTEPTAPLPPAWADKLTADPTFGPGDWDSIEVATGDLTVCHDKVIGVVRGITVFISRMDRCHEGVVTIGPIEVVMTDPEGQAFTPDEADLLSIYLGKAARLAMELESQK